LNDDSKILCKPCCFCTTFKDLPRAYIIFGKTQSSSDGVVAATLEININPVFTNDTTLDGALHYDFQAGLLKVLLQEADCNDLPADGIEYANVEEGPIINVSPSLSYNKSLDTITQTLPWTTYIQTLYFDFCDDSTGEN
jgi:hypothetical protein